MGNAVWGSGAADGAGSAMTLPAWEGLRGHAFASCMPDRADCLGSCSQGAGRFVDKSFPPTAASLGTPKPGRSFISGERLSKVKWIRLPELLRMNGWLAETELEGEPRLDWASIDPTDLAQGWIGNCWLIASIAALAEFPSAVQDLFVESDVAAGRYVVRLYDMSKAAWECVEVDDYIPCSHEADWSGVEHTVDETGCKVYRSEDVYNSHGLLKVPGVWVPLFGRPKGSKVWALLLEKAMAKFVGSYALLAGGAEPYALTAFTGFPLVYCFLRPAADLKGTVAELGHWDWRGAQYMSRDTTSHCCTKVPNAPSSLPDCEMWAKLVEFHARNFLMTASITKYEEPESQAGYYREDGLVFGHAYTVLSSRCAVDRLGAPLQLLLLRNPHGEGDCSACDARARTAEWNGKWSHSSACWEEHKEVALQVGYEPSSDGVFWMCWEDFRQIFDKVCVLAKPMAPPAGRRRPGRPEAGDAARKLGLGLEGMEGEGLLKELRQLSLAFDPFVNLPDFLDDGTLDTRLLWEATKPGRMQAYVDLNRASGNEAGYKLVMDKISELGLSAALGEDGCIWG